MPSLWFFLCIFCPCKEYRCLTFQNEMIPQLYVPVLPSFQLVSCFIAVRVSRMLTPNGEPPGLKCIFF